ncbi:hypothetical protein BHE90_010112 [Fusarium euwallaceae]|uniref:Uncharacterized protein n=1 Tax=Fusarium euwallaceae TaxID=1147111 RepID=A0A430LIB2_9HYPO|nr:hypothetical protein BHE90_010112 [Fusarium euwallaceae]
MRWYRDYEVCGIQDEAPPRHEVYSLGSEYDGDDIHVPGHPQEEPFPRYYSTWGFRYESCCHSRLSKNTANLRPCELNTPVLSEAEWVSGFLALQRVLAEIEKAVGGRIEVNKSCGTHVNVSFGGCLEDSDDDRLRTLKRFLTLIWLLEKHLLGFLCPDRENEYGSHLSSDREWQQDDVHTTDKGVTLEMGSTSISTLIDRVCTASRGSGIRRRAVRIHEVEEDEPKAIIDRTKEGDGDYAHDRADDSSTQDDDASLGDGHGSDSDTSESVDEQGGDIFSELPADETHSDHDEPLRFPWLHPDIRNLVVEIRHAPGTFSRQPEVRFRALSNDLYGITSTSAPSVRTAAAIIQAIRIYLDPMYQHTLVFDEAYFEQRNDEYEKGRDPNLDENQAWASNA